MRFYALRTFAGLTTLAGFCLMLPGIFVAIAMLSDGVNLNSPPARLAGLAIAVGAVLVGLPVMALGQLLSCVIAIEQHANVTASFLETVERNTNVTAAFLRDAAKKEVRQ